VRVDEAGDQKERAQRGRVAGATAGVSVGEPDDDALGD
jgi:hypothetical protein